MNTAAYCLSFARTEDLPRWTRTYAHGLRAATSGTVAENEVVYRSLVRRAFTLVEASNCRPMAVAAALRLLNAGPYADAHRIPHDCFDVAAILLEDEIEPQRMLGRIQDLLEPWCESQPETEPVSDSVVPVSPGWRYPKKRLPEMTEVRTWTVESIEAHPGHFQVLDSRGGSTGPFDSYEDAFDFLKQLAKTVNER